MIITYRETRTRRKMEKTITIAAILLLLSICIISVVVIIINSIQSLKSAFVQFALPGSLLLILIGLVVYAVIFVEGIPFL